MNNRRQEKERIRMMNALATVSSLAMMTVCDFFLAYYGGDWLDRYFQTGDHSFRLGCISLAVAAVFLTFFRLVYTAMTDEEDE